MEMTDVERFIQNLEDNKSERRVQLNYIPEPNRTSEPFRTSEAFRTSEPKIRKVEFRGLPQPKQQIKKIRKSVSQLVDPSTRQESSGGLDVTHLAIERQRALQRLESRLIPLTRAPRSEYYDGYLDMSPDNLARWLDASHLCPMMAEAKLRSSVTIRRSTTRKQETGSCRTPLKWNLGGGLCGIDRQGSPVYYLLFGLTDMLGIVNSTTRDDMVGFWLDFFDSMVEQVKKSRVEFGRDIHNILLIVDLRGFLHTNYQWPVLCAWAEVLQLYQDVCPGLFKEIVLINPPKELPVLHRYLMAALRRSTKELVTIIANPNFHKFLLLRIEKHELPAFLGGYRCDIDHNPLCKEHLLWPPKEVPRWAYLTDPRMSADTVNLVVQAGSTTSHNLQVPAPRSRVVWELIEVTHPVTLKIIPPADSTNKSEWSRLDKKHNAPPIFHERITNIDQMHGGAFVAEMAGDYSLILDNRMDLIHVIRAKVKVNIMPPKEHFTRFTKKRALGETINFRCPVSAEENARKIKAVEKAQALRCSIQVDNIIGR